MRKVLLICLAVCFVLAVSALAFDDMGKPRPLMVG